MATKRESVSLFYRGSDYMQHNITVVGDVVWDGDVAEFELDAIYHAEAPDSIAWAFSDAAIAHVNTMVSHKLTSERAMVSRGECDDERAQFDRTEARAINERRAA